ncbi:hypothetical protein GALL_126880 [mine drainage metagenome]|uniref:Uncharacterized protein n=1 Tax=mine drainage metagenome TaxID=410659 RepID=A0A1J5SAC0_9ZZZZ
MNMTLIESGSETSLHQIERALGRVPPLWPLRSVVAVNPYLGWLDLPIQEASTEHEAVRGTPIGMAPGDYLRAWESGRIAARHLDAVADESWTRAALLELVRRPSPRGACVRAYSDFLDEREPGSGWTAFVRDEIGKHCAAFLDERESFWRNSAGGRGLFAAWREASRVDRSPEVAGLAGFRGFVASLPTDPDACALECVRRLGMGAGMLERFFLRELHAVYGWASYLRYLERESRMEGRALRLVNALLAIRLCYDAALHWRHSDTPGLESAWHEALLCMEGTADEAEGLCRWQAAYELGYQESLVGALAGQPSPARTAAPEVQAVFCIDVRSEPLRRHLEAAHPSLQTLGFAGFFGFPVGHRTASGLLQARCPVLVSPGLETATNADASGPEAARVWRAVQSSGVAAFSFVETFGAAFAARLGLREKPACSRAPAAELTLERVPLERRVAMAEGALRGMSLTSGFARLVLVCGHGSRSANNPHASGLDCGACGGHAGDVNARVAAACLNDRAVRAALRGRGIHIPDETWFVAGLHDTMTDEVALEGAADAPATHAGLVSGLVASLARASEDTRSERVARQRIPVAGRGDLRRRLDRRAGDPSELRPEWGLANNAAFIAAPRSRTRSLDLGGRCFLHDYISENDPDGAILKAILSAPVVVASWINLQYFASSADPVNYAAGDKRLHNVVGGIGVFEGNGGDLKPGLPLQSVFEDGRRVHEPLRLSVFVQAERSKVDAALEAASDTAKLVENGWVHLFALEGGTCHRRVREGWVRVA